MRIPLEINPGLISDETSFATPGYYADGNNVRFWKGRPETDGGFTAFHETPLTGVCRTALAWTDRLSRSNIAFGTHTHLMLINQGEMYDITPAGLGAGVIDSEFFDGGYGSGGYGMGGYGVGATEDLARTWSLANYGEALIASPSGGAIYIWENDPTAVATVIPNAPGAVNRVVVTSTRQIVAIGCAQELDGVYNPMIARFSDSEDHTDWTTSPSNLASEEVFEGGGLLVSAANFGENLLFWSDTSLFFAEFTGDTTQPWRKTKIADGCGLIAPQAAIVVNQTAYWLTPDFQFYAYQYGGSPVPLPCPISREFNENVDPDQAAKIVCASTGKFQEVSWYYPDRRDGDEISRFIRVNVGDPALPWSKGDIARTAYIDSGPLLHPLAVDYDGQTYLHENGNSANGDALSWFFETSLQYLGNGERRVLLLGIWPDFEAQQGDVSLSMKTQTYPQATPVWKGPYTLAAGREKRDFMVEGRLFAIRMSGSADPSFMRLGKPTFDAVATGQR